jgi:hypothetical protein
MTYSFCGMIVHSLCIYCNLKNNGQEDQFDAQAVFGQFNN